MISGSIYWECQNPTSEHDVKQEVYIYKASPADIRTEETSSFSREAKRIPRCKFTPIVYFSEIRSAERMLNGFSFSSFDWFNSLLIPARYFAMFFLDSISYSASNVIVSMIGEPPP